MLLNLCLVTFDVIVIKAIRCWNEIWLVSDEARGWGGSASAAFSGLEACCLPSRPGGASRFGCYLQVRLQSDPARSRVLTILFVVAENWWTLLYLYGDAAFYCCVSRSRSLEKITSECFFAEILTKWTGLQSLVHNLVHCQASEASCGYGGSFGGAGSCRKVWQSNAS